MNKTIWPHYTMKWPNAYSHPKTRLLPEVAVCPKVSSCCVHSVICVLVCVRLCVLLPIITSVLNQCWRLCQALFFLFLPNFCVSSPLKNKQTKLESFLMPLWHHVLKPVFYLMPVTSWSSDPPARPSLRMWACEHWARGVKAPEEHRGQLPPGGAAAAL